MSFKPLELDSFAESENACGHLLRAFELHMIVLDHRLAKMRLTSVCLDSLVLVTDLIQQ